MDIAEVVPASPIVIPLLNVQITQEFRPLSASVDISDEVALTKKVEGIPAWCFSRKIKLPAISQAFILFSDAWDIPSTILFNVKSRPVINELT
jgi:hypothetical protein